jgi:hypothetical protein
MKHTFFAFLVMTTLTLGATYAFATVGGPTTVYDFMYNPADESVYYTTTTAGGRGCPPELFKLSLNTEQSSVALSCNQGEAMKTDVGQYIRTITSSYKYLSSLSLKKNNIEIDVVYLDSQPLFEDASSADYFYRRLVARVYQNGIKVDEFPLRGCNLEQPFLFAGYSIPGFNKKIIILSSTKGDCVEGGYTYESLHVIGGVDALDKTSGNSYKTRSELVPNEETLIVYEGDTVQTERVPDEIVETTPKPNDAKPTTPESRDTLYRILTLSGITLVIGFLFGRKFRVSP